MKKISFIIPNYNGSKLLKKHLPSVFAQMKSGDELIVIDDASTDKSLDYLQSLQKKYPELTIISNGQNMRFAASVNKAVAASKHDYILLLNNDVELLAKARDELVAEMKPNVFAVGCLEYETHNNNDLAGKNKLWFERGLFVHSKASEFSSGETAWASGGSALFDKKKWQELGGFDLSFYPAYWEDIDLSYRARKKDWKVLFSAEARVEHQHESTNNTAFGQKKLELISLKNSLIFAWKHMSLTQWFEHIFFLPYHLLLTTIRTKGIFLEALLLALRQIFFGK